MRGLPILESLSFAKNATGDGRVWTSRWRATAHEVRSARCKVLSPADQHPAAASKPSDESEEASATNAADGVANSMFEISQ